MNRVAATRDSTAARLPDRSTAIVWVLCAAAFMAMLDVFVVNVAFTSIGASYRGSSLADLSWVLNGYAIVYAALLIPAGRFSDRFGRKAGFLAGLGVFTLASLLCAVAPSLWVLVGCRVSQAIGAATLTPASLGLLLTVLPAARVPGAVKIWATTSSFAAAIGPVVGGALVEASWRWVFLINLPVGVIAGIAALRMVPDLRQEVSARMPDLLGVGLLVVAIGALSLGLVESGEWSWTSAATIAALAVAALGLILFVVRMLRHADPVVSPELFRVPTFVWANITVLLFCTAFGAWFLSIALWLENAAGFDTVRTGLAIVPGPIMVPIFAVVAQRLLARISVGVVVALGNLLFAVGVALVVTSAATPVHYASQVLPGWMLSGIGIGLALPSMIASAAIDLPPQRSATGSAVVNTARQLGYVLGVAVLVAVLGSLGDRPERLLIAFRHGWWFVTAVAAVSAVTAVGLTPRARTK
ncbi:DHA2 family efflux MFS transporter permease subunit [Nocardia pseudobrasiliensis]|uniref:EmrB/QacA subfamily drug resistance transporter n=1 Tax=Nocardia pseudobrasiliensis TaxID=45979 RepID=A0A370HZ41_9NOCA|nr:DHA2 family efflux MFS transporter permease subunit [Nocardia pseudobrasiliensis]RDI63756.1 EmrB/QacA subfamily drug resistance transporter [Nocardia pseudobrasiliensis]